MCNLNLCEMKTKIIAILSAIILIPAFSYADPDGGKTTEPDGTSETLTAEVNITPAANLIVLNMSEAENASLGLPQDILDQFSNVLAYPEDVDDANDEECVLVGFTYDDDGFIRVKNTRSSNDSFTKHVTGNIEKIRLRNGSVTIGKEYYAKFSFKKL